VTHIHSLATDHFGLRSFGEHFEEYFSGMDVAATFLFMLFDLRCLSEAPLINTTINFVCSLTLLQGKSISDC